MRNFDRSPPPRRLAMGKIGSLGLWVYSRSSLQLGFGALLLAVAPKSHAMIPFGVALSAASSVANMIGSQNQGGWWLSGDHEGHARVPAHNLEAVARRSGRADVGLAED